MTSRSLLRVLFTGLTCVLVAACSGQRLGPAAEAPSATPTVRPRFTPIPTATPEPDRAAAAAHEQPPSPTPAATAAPDYTKPPVPATDPAGIAQQLVMVEKAIRDPGVGGAQLVWMGHLQQLAYSQLQDNPDWKDQVLAALPAEVRPSVTNILEAGKQLRNMHGPVPKQLPDWKIVEPAPLERLLQYYKEAEAKFGVAWYYLAAIHLVETRMGRIRGLSTAGAQGPMQFIPSTWAAYGEGDVNSDHDAILAAGRYLKAAGAPANMSKAVFAYNHSDFYVKAVLAYAEAMKIDQNAYRGYYGWQVYYPTEDGPVLLAVGWKNE